MKGSGKITESSDSVSKGLYLLFAPGKRPDRVAIRKFVAAQPGVSISHDPLDSAPIQLAAADGEQIKPERSADAAHDDLVWVEVLREGLAFDLTGLAPGEKSVTVSTSGDAKNSSDRNGTYSPNGTRCIL